VLSRTMDKYFWFCKPAGKSGIDMDEFLYL